MAIIQAIKQHEDEFDRFVSDDDDEELGESQFNPDIIQGSILDSKLAF
ncbi:hypothetical protein OROGR_030735 [Orobanche gracilis]